MRPSPFHKGSGQGKPSTVPSALGKPPRPAPKKTVANKRVDSNEDEGVHLSDDSDIEEVAAVPVARAPTSRRAAATRTARYVEEISGDRWEHCSFGGG